MLSRGVRSARLETIMPSNFDKMVRARMAKTGEGWQQAARHVRGQAARAAGEAAEVVQAVEGLRRLSASGKSIRGPLLTAVYEACDAAHSGLSINMGPEVSRATRAFRAAYHEVGRRELADVRALADAEALREPNVIEDGFEDLEDEARAGYRAAIERLDAGIELDRSNGTHLIVASLRPASLALLRYLVGLTDPGTPRPDVRVLSQQEALERRASRFDRMRQARDARGDTAADDQELLRCAVRIVDAISAREGDPNSPTPR